jgi:hypothetical protein
MLPLIQQLSLRSVTLNNKRVTRVNSVYTLVPSRLKNVLHAGLATTVLELQDPMLGKYVKLVCIAQVLKNNLTLVCKPIISTLH